MVLSDHSFKALAESLGRYILPREVVDDYRCRVHEIERSVLVFTLDSCRYDVFVDAYSGQLPAKKVRRAYSPSHWTLPSHESIARGQIPFGDFVSPFEDIPYNGTPLPRQHEYSFGSTAMPYLSDAEQLMNNLHRYFDNYSCAEEIDSSQEVLEKAAEFIDPEADFFGLVNLGETHSPYRDFQDQTTDELRERLQSGDLSYETLYDWQVESAKELIEEIAEFRDHIPEGTLVVVTSDHGELFGEEDSFGHNPQKDAIFHSKLYEVPVIYWTES